MKISDLEKTPTGPVWVTNVTEGADRSIIVLAVPRPNGTGVDSVKIPVTWIPIDLTGQVPKRQLMQSSDFRRAVTGGALMLMEEEAADKIRKEPGARAEITRLQAEERSVTSASAKLTAGTTELEAQAGTVSARVQQFMVNMEEAKDQSASLNTLRSMGRLQEAELRAVSALAGARRFTDIVAFCEKAIETA